MDVTMSKVLDQIENRGIEIGRREGRQEGRSETYVTVYLNCRRRGMSVEDAKNLIGIDDKNAIVAEEKFQCE